MTVNTNGPANVEVSAQVAARAPAQYTEQVVIMEEKHVFEALETLRKEFGLPRSLVAREALRVGLPVVADRLRGQRDSIMRVAVTGE